MITPADEREDPPYCPQCDVVLSQEQRRSLVAPYCSKKCLEEALGHGED